MQTVFINEAYFLKGDLVDISSKDPEIKTPLLQ